MEIITKEYKLKSLYEEIKSININEEILKDIEEFLDDFYYDRKPKTLNISLLNGINDKEKYIGFELNNQKIEFSINGQIKFFGNGIYKYSFIINKKEVVTKIKIEDIGHYVLLDKETGKHVYIFNLISVVNDGLSCEESFATEIKNKIELNSVHKKYVDKISFSWSLNYYDGPISGMAQYKNKLYYYALKEEKEYSGERLYAVYKLTNKEKLFSKINHYCWFKILNWKLNMKLYKIISRIFKVEYKDIEKREIVGHFIY